MKRQSHTIVLSRLLRQICQPLTLTPLVTLIVGAWCPLAVNAENQGSTERSLLSESFSPREVDFQALPTPPVPNQPSPPSESYLVYTGAGNSQELQQVQQLEPAAFMRQYRGKFVIQAGIFSQNANAQKLANQLEAQGIDVRIANLTTGKDQDFVSNHKFYFVVIPAKPDKLATIENQVKQLRMGMQVKIAQKEQPRTHVRVGPFLEKKQAENWRRYLRASGLRKARVYYGR